MQSILPLYTVKMAAQGFNFMKDQLLFGGKVAVLMKGTSDDESPIPGYLYEEIKDLSSQSPANCEFLLEFLVKRIDKPSCHVKFKTLRLMKHLVEKGAPAFREGLLKKSGCIHEATKFGGPPHPLHGSVPYQAVRQLAKELSMILTEVNTQPRPNSPHSQEQLAVRKMVGIGPGTSASGGRYYGFGNTPKAKKSLGDTLREGIEKLAELSESPTQRQAALIAQLEKNSSGDYVPPDVPPPAPRATSVTQSPVKKAVAKSYAPGRAGGGWDTVVDTAQGQESGTHSEGSSDFADRLEPSLTSDWSAEEQLVTKYLLLEDRSQFFLLRPSQMQLFKKECQVLNCEKVVDYLGERLKSTDDYAVVRALLLLETFLLRSDAVSLDYIVAVCQYQLNQLSRSSADQRIRDKAEKIIRGLEVYSNHPNIFVPVDIES